MTNASVSLLPGLPEPVLDAQRIFRMVLDAMARPGVVHTLPASLPAPSGLDEATVGVCLTLLDLDSPLWVQDSATQAEVVAHLRFHCGMPLVASPGEAQFALALAPEALPPLETLNLGTDEYPDRSVTVILQVRGLEPRTGLRLRGPGIEQEARLSVHGLAPSFWQERAALAELFPRGADVILTAGRALACLPRTTIVES